jgi:fatty-acyl-CoA synthase
MKLSFSTLGCPRWSLGEMYSTAKDLGFNGIEIRGVADELYAPKIKAFQDDKIKETIDKLNQLKIEIPILTSDCALANYQDKEKALIEAKDYIILAKKLGVKYIRVMCTNSATPNGGDYELAVKSYKEIADFAEKYDVIPLMETNGFFCDTALLNKFMKEVDRKNIGVLWDIHHPYRYNGEDIKTSLKNIGKYVKHTHLKDSVIINGMTQYKMMGYGDVPLVEAVKELQNMGYKGYYSLEWTKRWNINLEEPGIVFSHYVNFMKGVK